MSKQLAELLVKDRIITTAQYSEADSASADERNIVRYLIEKRQLSETKLMYYLSQKFGLPSINLAKFEIKDDVLRLVSPDVAKSIGAVPIQSNKGTLVVAICDPTILPKLEDLKFRVKMNVEAVLTSFSAFDETLAKHFGGQAYVGHAIESFQREAEKSRNDSSSSASSKKDIDLAEVHDIDSSSTEDDAPVITLVNGLLSECIRRGASDIHVEPYEKMMRVRLRIDGKLIQIAEVPLEMKRAVAARLKIMSRMDIAETRVPQDGRIKLKAAGREIDFRVSTMPTIFGEKVVLRMLSKGNLQLDLSHLGFEKKQIDTFLKGIMSPNGMVLVTGPTGSGKTTTLYSALMELNKVSENLSTAEDPVEYNLQGINQVQVRKDVGLTFASVLRTLLRQDPDVILVGEIRDYETAEVATQAALTGHLVLSTLHTNDAPSAITRLMNMGIEPFLVTACVNTIVAQRLVRKICDGCKVETPVPHEKLVELGFTDQAAAQMKIYKGAGCQACNQSGYKGRVAIYEVLDFTPDLKDLVLKGATVLDLKRAAAQSGMTSLRSAALTKVAQGLTTLEEALSITMEG